MTIACDLKFSEGVLVQSQQTAIPQREIASNREPAFDEDMGLGI